MNSAQFNLYAYFCGRWTFARSMLGADGRHFADAEGEAEFLPAAECAVLHYKEAGQLRMSAGQRVVAFSRRFDYVVTGETETVHVTFADGAQAGQAYQSYRYDPEQKMLIPMQTHLCVLDRYNGSYTFVDHDRFDLHTRIEGPHKDYQLHTRFTRPPAD